MSEIKIHKPGNGFHKRVTNPIHIIPQRVHFRRKSRVSDSFIQENHYLRLSEPYNPNDLPPLDPSIFQPYYSIFNSSNSKNTLSRDHSSPNSAQRPRYSRKLVKKLHSRVESLNLLVKQCVNIQEDGKTSRILLKHSKKACDSILRIKKDIESCQEISHDIISSEKSVKNMKIDAQALRLQLGIDTEKHKGKKKRIWKFVSPALTKKTEKLIMSVEKKLESRKSLRK